MKELIHNLVKVLEKMEDDLVFTVFYSFAKFQESHHFTPAWNFDAYYYEIQYDNSNEPQVVRWYHKTPINTKGDVLSEKEITKLTKELVEFWAEKELKRGEIVSYLADNTPTININEDIVYSIRMENLTTEEIIKRYGNNLDV